MSKNKEYCILRTEKVKTRSSVSRSYNHIFRLKDIASSIPEYQQYNIDVVRPDTDDILEVLDERLKKCGYGKDKTDKHLRSNSIQAIECVFEFSPEAQDHMDIQQWIRDNMEWTHSEFDDAPEWAGSNIIAACYHADEKGNIGPDGQVLNNGHMHVLIQPIDKNGNLNASMYLGNRDDYIRRQDTYYEIVGKRHGLCRGDRGTVAQHVSNKVYNREMTKKIEKARIVPKENETPKEVADRANEKTEWMAVQYQKKEHKLKREIIEEKNKVRELQEKNYALENQLNELGGYKKALTKVRAIDGLQFALKNYPEREDIDLLTEEINGLTEWGREHIQQREQNLEI